MKLIISIMVIFFITNISCIVNAEWKTYTNEELFKLGNQAIERKDWMATLKYLFAYQVRIEPLRNQISRQDQDFLVKQISNAENHLKTQLAKKNINTQDIRISTTRNPLMTEGKNIRKTTTINTHGLEADR